MLKKNNSRAFTFVELIIVVTILTILSTIGFYSYIGKLGDTRDTKRMSDLALVETALISYKQYRGAYPHPGESFNITNNGTGVTKQGFLNKQVSLSTLDNIPLDPETDGEYFYGVTNNKQEFQVAGTLENGDELKSIVIGDYKSVSKNVLPTILLATSTGAGLDVEINSGTIDGAINRTKFIFNDSSSNYPYTFDGSNGPYSAGITFDELLAEAEAKDFWQNSEYTSCTEILDAGKSIGDGEYQIIDSITGSLTSTGCTGM